MNTYIHTYICTQSHAGLARKLPAPNSGKMRQILHSGIILRRHNLGVGASTQRNLGQNYGPQNQARIGAYYHE